MPKKAFDPGLEQIEKWEAWLIAANEDQWRRDAYDDDMIARARPAMLALVRAAADSMRADYLSRRPS